MPIYGLFHAKTRLKRSVFTFGQYNSSDDLVNKHATCIMSLLGHTLKLQTCTPSTRAERGNGTSYSPPPQTHAYLSHPTLTYPHSHTPSHTHYIKPYLSVDLYTERSGSSQSSITAPSSRPCGFHDNRIIMIKYRICLL